MKLPSINEVVNQVRATVQRMPLEKEASFVPTTDIAKELQSLAGRLKTAKLYTVTHGEVIALGQKLVGDQNGS